MRLSRIQRVTTETKITGTLQVDGTGLFDIDTGCGFLNHMLELFACHGRFDITLQCQGDVQVDYHHTVEDVALVLGRAFSDALGDRAGIYRYGSTILPMDEALVLASVDICGRPTLGYALELTTEKIGDFDCELVQEFFRAFSTSLGAAIHLQQFAGKNSHHITEGAFKAFARALAIATDIDKAAMGEIPSTKGTIL